MRATLGDGFVSVYPQGPPVPTSASASGVLLIGASAGSGKTTRLSREVTRAIDPAAPDRIAVDALAAVTYTRKGAAELVDRIRGALISAGEATEAARLPLAHLGTVHAVCLRLLEEYALDAGLSPHIEVVAGDPGKLLRQALERSIDVGLRDRMDLLARRLQIFWDARVQRTDWIRPVGEIMETARGNRIDPDRLPEMGRRSAERLLALLPAPAPSGAALDDALVRELEQADRALARSVDGTGVTANAKKIITEALHRLHRRPLHWSDWLRLARLKPGKASVPLVAPVTAAAAACERHPRLHEELAEFTAGVFEAARQGLAGYAAWKVERRLVDYVDMIDRGLALAEDPAVSQELAHRLKLLVVDELQDTSPLQLALFTRLHFLAGRSVWVGDPKQCIFEYAGADPLLMDAVATWVRESGGASDTLSDNHRSRPELVEVVNRIFAPAFARSGTAPASVEVSAARPARLEQSELPPLGVFWLDSKNATDDAGAMAEGVVRLLADAAGTPVVDRESEAVRPLAPGDIAILTATNAEAEAVATALEDRGIGAALARPGLMSSPEGTLAEAALRWLLDPADALAGAVLDALTGWNGLDPDHYLAARIAARAAAEGDRAFAWQSEWTGALEKVRAALDHLSPAEALERALFALDAQALCARWPEPEQRGGNLDALLALAAAYEPRCERQREAATLAGLLRYMGEAATPILTRDEERASDEQHVRGGDHAVTVTTYHRTKGLEWPVVILSSLDRKERRSPFDVTPESDCAAFDPSDPLAGRWIRYWPWPFGQQTTAPLAVAADASPEGQRVKARESRERVRLLYVGFTRARDHLVFAARRTKGKAKTQWLGELCGGGGESLIGLPVGAADGAVDSVGIAASTSVPARVWALSPAAPARASEPPPPRRFARPADLADRLARPAYWIAPSGAKDAWPELAGVARVGQIIPLAGRADLRRAGAIDWAQAGQALHAFFASEVYEGVEGVPADLRAERARRILDGASLAGHLGADWLLAASDALRAFIASRWPGAKAAHEIPLTAFLPGPLGRRRIEGTIDLLVDAGASVAVIDHKSFPAWSEHACRTKAAELAPQLLAYRRALELLGKSVESQWFHFPLAGMMVEVVVEERKR